MTDDTPRTITVSEPTSYDVHLADLRPSQYRQVMDALSPLGVGLQTTVTAQVHLTPELTAKITGVETVAAPGVSIAGEDLPIGPDRCQRCGHPEAIHAGILTPGYGPQCEHRTERESGAGGYTFDRCPCAGWVPGGLAMPYQPTGSR